jgi:cyclic pyranopterin phosphate synthase
MVDVSDKATTRRVAVAQGVVHMREGTVQALRSATLKKGDAIATARLAGIMAAKRTAELIPLCHALPLDHVEVRIELGDTTATIIATATVTSRTGVEMEALTAVSVAALTLYDMCKAIDRDMVIAGIMLVEKHGGRSGSWVRDPTPPVPDAPATTATAPAHPNAPTDER